MMIGAILMPPRRDGGAVGEVRLRLDRLSLPTERPFGVDLRDISLDVRAAEIVGIAGVAGNGQEELMTALIGEHTLKSPEALQFDGQPVGGKGPDERRALGMCFVPEERLGHAAVPNMTLVENTALSARVRKSLCRSGFINFQRTEEFSKEIVEKFNVRTAGVDHAARSLSGGNLQKFLVGREMLQAPSVLIASQPTWGVDAGAAAAIHQALIQLARDGAAILIISQDLDELMAICDRIAVISHGRLTDARPVEQLTIEGIGVDMGGQAEGSAAYA
jgi:simple sugar transport system ATP-binding protein